jgi:hypothetical protein
MVFQSYDAGKPPCFALTLRMSTQWVDGMCADIEAVR